MQVQIDTDLRASVASDAYLRLHLLSHRLMQPRTINLDGIFGQLTNVAWTNLGPAPVEGLEELRWRVRHDGGVLTVHGLDKFPRMTDYVVPSGVRIADTDRVRLGAHLSPGTTVMHEGFCNFNAGTLGTSMVEGRISQGVLVGDGSDIGGGASIMGTLSGGGTEQITIGERCLLGAEAGIGISLGDECIVEAGLYVTAGTLVSAARRQRRIGAACVKARKLSGKGGLLYRRNSQSGAVEALPRSAKWTASTPTCTPTSVSSVEGLLRFEVFVRDLPHENARTQNPELPGAFAAFDVVVDEAHRLHERIHRGRADETPAAALQVLRHRDGLGTRRRHLAARRSVAQFEPGGIATRTCRSNRTRRAVRARDWHC